MTSKYRQYLDTVYNKKIQREYDRVIPVIGDEGVGKSTLMLVTVMHWQEILDQDGGPTADSVLERIVWDSRAEFKRAMADYPLRAAIPVMDATRALHRKEAMTKEQVDIEKDLFDVRTKEHLILLGYQDWDTIPSSIQRRRAKNVIYIPERGVAHIFSRDSTDERLRDDEWPEPDYRAAFPSLDGTELWNKFQRIDRERKINRMRSAAVGDADETHTPQEVVAEIKNKGVGGYVKHNEFNGRTHLVVERIQFDYPELSQGEAKQVKEALLRDGIDPDEVWETQMGGEGGKN